MIRSLRLLALCLAAAWLSPGLAGPTDITQKPLIVANPNAVKANLLFIIDDSGSMDWDFLPDHVNSGLCRSGGATPENSGTFTGQCCNGATGSSACWVNDAPFGVARGQPPFLAAGFNGVAYDPGIVYKPPAMANGTAWPSQTRAATGGGTNGWQSVKNDAYNVQNTNDINLLTEYPDTEWCVDDGTFSDCLRNDNYVLPGTVNGKAYTRFNAVTATGTGRVATGAPDAATVADRKFGPHYYRIVPAEYCSSSDLRNCSAQAGGEFTIPAPVRWCNTDANARKATPDAGACQATRNGNYSHARYPTKFFSAGVNAQGRGSSLTFTVGTGNCTGSRTATYTSLKIDGVEMLSGATTNSNNASTLATSLAGKFSGPPGWTISRNNRTITITAPVSAGTKTGTSASFTTATGNGTCAPSPSGNNAVAFANDYQPFQAATPGTYAGRFERVDIHPDTTSYARPSSRSDCAGIANSGNAGTCTYDEEMTNFANWWTYYHTRMQTMKTSASLAFKDVGNNRRVGYMSINNATKSDFVNLGVFEGTQRTNWFTKLTSAKPSGSTPLRGALSKAGRLYAGSYNGQKINGVDVTEPLEYSCQRNATILSTDGYWNQDLTPTRPNGSEIGDVDSATGVERPMYDGTASTNTLADTAYYFYKTDLRNPAVSGAVCTAVDGTDICNNGDRGDAPQVMMTFTLGLGVSGYMQFAKKYETGESADFNAVKNGDTANGTICSWQTTGACNWPVPANNSLTAVDDLWHAAVNGGGTYFSASDPTSLYTGLRDALRTFDAKTGAAAAATTSNPNVTSGDNKAFVSNFTSSQWTGQLESKAIDLDDGQLKTLNWAARELLDATASRRVLMFDSSGGSTTKLKNFDYDLMGSYKAYFESTHITASGRALTQFCSGPSYCLSTTSQTAASGKKLVDYLRGDRSNEGELEDGSKYYRKRVHLLGDIVNSEAVYVNKQLVNYADAGYATFKTGARRPMVYAGANDGMLHAFDANTGQEIWAYVPTAVLPNMYKLADKQYATNHQYFVDATPFAQDVQIGGEWRTILVGGLGGGGRAYYALDITNPDEPKALWEFGVMPGDTSSNCPTGTARCNMGYTFGLPEIGKLRGGKWVVVVPSGYNNISPGDGKARLFVLDVATGQPVTEMPAGIIANAGDTTTPAGLGHIRGWVDDSGLDNTIQRVYGGDNLGNVWRFDVNDTVGAAGREAVNLGILMNAAGTAQPVTSRPELGQVSELAMVYVGTGRYMGQADVSDTSKQTIYGIKDELKSTGHGEVRASGKFIQQTLVSGTCPAGTSWCKAGQAVRTSASFNAVNLAQDSGWFVDLPLDRERVNNDPLLVLGTLIVISNVIQPGDLCKAGGSSWVNYFDYTTGRASSVPLGDVLSSRPTVYLLPNGKLVGLARDSSGGDRYFQPPIDPTVGLTRRISWRDLQQQ